MELQEKLKVVAEYDGWVWRSEYRQWSKTTTDGVHTNTRYVSDLQIQDFQYHTSFDWSVPVYSKAIKEADEVNFNHKNNSGSEKIDSERFHIDMVDAIESDDKLAFFENLYNLITELQKAKQ